MDWGKRIREFRFLEGLKQDALASQLGVSQAAVSQWERGVVDPPEQFRAQLLKRVQLTPTTQMVRALRDNVTHNPNPYALTEFDGGDMVLRAFSHEGFRRMPLVDESDLGEAINGRLGEQVQGNIERLIKSGAFEGEVASASSRHDATRNGHVFAVQATYSPFRVEKEVWLLRADIRWIQDEDAPAERGLEIRRF